MRLINISIVLVLLFLITAIASSESRAQDIYKYYDAEGNLNYVDDPESIPPEFQDKKTKVKPEEGVNLDFEESSRRQQGAKKEQADPAHERQKNAQQKNPAQEAQMMWEQKAVCANEKVALLKEMKQELENKFGAANFEKNTQKSLGAFQKTAILGQMMQSIDGQLKQAEEYQKSGLEAEARRAAIPLEWIKRPTLVKICPEVASARASYKNSLNSIDSIGSAGPQNQPMPQQSPLNSLSPQPQGQGPAGVIAPKDWENINKNNTNYR